MPVAVQMTIIQIYFIQVVDKVTNVTNNMQ